MSWIWVNGDWCEDSRPVLSALDRGFLYGDGVFETLRVYDGEIFQLPAHWQRMAASSEFLRIPLDLTLEEAGRIVAELLGKNGESGAVVRITLSRGAASPGLRIGGAAEPTLIFQSRAFRPYPGEIYRRGADLIIARVRQNGDSPLPRHKTSNYLLYCLARQEAFDAKAHDALLLNQHGQVCETSVANLFWVMGSVVHTPPIHCGLLPGITRQNIFRIAESEGVPCRETAIPAGDLFDMDEVFMTNSLMEIAPVRRIDNRRIGEKAPGELTARLMARYRDRESWCLSD